MRKPLCILAGLFLLCAPGFTAVADESASPVLTIFTGNDLFNAEWTLDRDDYRSYYVGAGVSWGEDWDARFQFSGFTDRERGTRRDELELLCTKSILWDWGPSELSLTPGVGLSIDGNLGGQEAQNIIHTIFGLYLTDMAYEEPTAASLFATTRCSYAYFWDLPGATLGIQAVGKLQGYLPSRSSASLGTGVSWQDFGGGLTLGGEAGYRWDFGDLGAAVIAQAREVESGAYIHLGFTAGLLSYGATYYPQSDFSTGEIAITAPLSNDSTRERGAIESEGALPSFILETSLDFFCWERGIRITVPVAAFGSSWLGYFVDYSYGDEKRDFQNTVSQFRFMQGTGGLSFALPIGRLPVLAALAIAGGARQEKKWTAEGVDPQWAPVLAPELSLRSRTLRLPILGPAPVRYGLALRYGVQFMGGDVVVPIQHYLSLGLSIWGE